MDAGSMGQQVVNGHLVAAGIVRDKLGKLGRWVELSVFMQFEDGCGRELLADRPDAELRLRRDRHAMLEVGQAVALFTKNLAIFGNQDSRSRPTALQQIMEGSVDELIQLGPRAG